VAEVRVRGLASAGAEVAVGDGPPVPARATAAQATPGTAGGDSASEPSGTLSVSYDGRVRRYAYARTGPATAADGDGVLWLSRDGRTWALTEQRAVTSRSAAAAGAGAGDGTVRAPMPGTVIAVLAEAGQPVSAGQRLVIVEAMKMEHTVTAPADGVVAELTVKAGQQVTMNETLAVIGPVPGNTEPADSGSLEARRCS
jgi:acetyl-CoA/propionyl-CoA carboxylase biotin carboxyl carrier protein